MTIEDYEIAQNIFNKMENFFDEHNKDFYYYDINKKKEVSFKFADMVTSDFRDFKIAMALIEKYKETPTMHIFFTRVHHSLTTFRKVYGEHKKYLEYFDKADLANLKMMRHRINYGKRKKEDDKDDNQNAKSRSQLKGT